MRSSHEGLGDRQDENQTLCRSRFEGIEGRCIVHLHKGEHSLYFVSLCVDKVLKIEILVYCSCSNFVLFVERVRGYSVKYIGRV